MENKALIIGGEHHNTLAVMRCLGKEKVDFEILIHTPKTRLKDINLFHSKYAKNMFLVKDKEEAILEWLIKNKENTKKVIIPCSDIVEYTIDKYYDKLKDFYYIPGFKNHPGKVCQMMDKYEQKKWADKNKILMAKTWSIELKKDSFEMPKDIVYPCIVKPEISAYGEKGDIRIVKSSDNIQAILKEFSRKGYKRVLIQEFLIKDYEICAFGCIVDTPEIAYGSVIKKIRENPPTGGGSLTFAMFTNNDKLLLAANEVIKKLADDGYRGLYDIEFLVCKDKIYLNEINFRHSGNGFALVANGIKAPYINYLDSLKQPLPKENQLKYPNGYLIDDINEINLFLHKDISFKEMLADFKKAYVSSTYAKDDKFVFWNYLQNKILSKMKGLIMREEKERKVNNRSTTGGVINYNLSYKLVFSLNNA